MPRGDPSGGARSSFLDPADALHAATGREARLHLVGPDGGALSDVKTLSRCLAPPEDPDRRRSYGRWLHAVRQSDPFVMRKLSA